MAIALALFLKKENITAGPKNGINEDYTAHK
jgi:hypothetical protein